VDALANGQSQPVPGQGDQLAPVELEDLDAA
jgi:hypothetical protein